MQTNAAAAAAELRQPVRGKLQFVQRDRVDGAAVGGIKGLAGLLCVFGLMDHCGNAAYDLKNARHSRSTHAAANAAAVIYFYHLRDLLLKYETIIAEKQPVCIPSRKKIEKSVTGKVL